jgi:hypothetical protein
MLLGEQKFKLLEYVGDDLLPIKFHFLFVRLGEVRVLLIFRVGISLVLVHILTSNYEGEIIFLVGGVLVFIGLGLVIRLVGLRFFKIYRNGLAE